MQKMKRKVQRRRLVRKAKAERSDRKETRVLVGEILSDLLTSLPGSGKEKMPHPDSDEAEGINDVGRNAEQHESITRNGAKYKSIMIILCATRRSPPAHPKLRNPKTVA